VPLAPMHGEVRLRVTLTAHSRPWTRVPANRACGAWDTCVCVRRRASAAARATRDPRRPEMCVGRALMPGAPTRPCMGKPDLAHVPRRVWTWWHAIRVWPCPVLWCCVCHGVEGPAPGVEGRAQPCWHMCARPLRRNSGARDLVRVACGEHLSSPEWPTVGCWWNDTLRRRWRGRPALQRRNAHVGLLAAASHLRVTNLEAGTPWASASAKRGGS